MISEVAKRLSADPGADIEDLRVALIKPVSAIRAQEKRAAAEKEKAALARASRNREIALKFKAKQESEEVLGAKILKLRDEEHLPWTEIRAAVGINSHQRVTELYRRTSASSSQPVKAASPETIGLQDIDFSAPVSNCFIRSGLHTVSDLLLLGQAGLRARGLKDRGLQEVVDFLQGYGLKLPDGPNTHAYKVIDLPLPWQAQRFFALVGIITIRDLMDHGEKWLIDSDYPIEVNGLKRVLKSRFSLELPSASARKVDAPTPHRRLIAEDERWRLVYL